MSTHSMFGCRALMALLTFLAAWLQVSAALGEPMTLDLKKAYDLAWERQERIEIARREVEKKKLLPKRALEKYLPYVAVNGLYTGLDDEIEFRDIDVVPHEQWSANFEIRQPIYDAEYFPTRRQAYDAIGGEVAAYRQTSQDVLYEVAEAYYEALKARKLVENAQEILKLAQDELKVASARHRSGAVTEDVEIRAELHVTESSSKVTQARNDLALAKDRLKQLCGLEGTDFELGESYHFPQTEARYEDLVEMALDQRWDYKAARLGVKVAQRDIDRVHARFQPTVAGSWNYYWVDDPSFEQDDEYWVGAVQVTFPLFEAGERFWDLKEKRQNLNQANLALKQIYRDIQIEIEDALHAVENQQALLDNVRKQVELAGKSYDFTFARFRNGSATDFELSQARTLLATVKADLITKTYDYQVILLSLEKATGVFAADFTSGKVPEPEFVEADFLGETGGHPDQSPPLFTPDVEPSDASWNPSWPDRPVASEWNPHK